MRALAHGRPQAVRISRPALQCTLAAPRRAVTRAFPEHMSISRPNGLAGPCGRRSVVASIRRPRSSHLTSVEPAEVAEEEAIGVIVDKPDSRVDLERLFEMSSEDPRTDQPVAFESLMADVDKLGLEAEALSADALHMPSFREEVAELTKSLDLLSSAGKAPRRERGKARAAKRASRRRPVTRKKSSLADAVVTPRVVSAQAMPVLDRAGEATTSGRHMTSSRAARLQGMGKVAPNGTPTAGKAKRSKKGTSGSHLVHVGTTKVLTAEEEFSLGCKVQKFIKLEAKRNELAKELQYEPTMFEFATSLGTSNVSGLEELMDRGATYKAAFLAANTRLVVSIARKMRPRGRGIALQDLVGEGMNGLEKGLERFDPHRGFKFSTYAHWWIRQAISTVIDEQSTVVRFPPSLQVAARRALTVRSQLKEKLGRAPANTEVALAAGISNRRLKQVMMVYASSSSLDAPMGSDASGATLADIVEDPNAADDDKASSHECMARDLEEILRSLTHREASILRLRYGLPVDGEPTRRATLQEIGERFSVTKERIRQIEGKALCKVRALRGKQLDGHAAILESEWASRSEAMHSKN